MTTRTTEHDTVVVRRSFDVAAGRVFQAWRDPAALARWYMPGSDWTNDIKEHDFRTGGVMRLTFGPKGETPYTEDCLYEDIVPDARIVCAMRIGRGGVCLTASMVTVEFIDRGSRSDLIVTDQIAILDGADTAAERERGWGETLDKLGTEVAREHARSA